VNYVEKQVREMIVKDGNGDNSGYLEVRCNLETAIRLSELLWKQDKIRMSLSQDYVDANIIRVKLFLGAGSSLVEGRNALIADLKQNGFLAEESKFEIQTTTEEKDKWQPSFSQAHAHMTEEKFQLLMDFLVERMREQAEKLKSPGWEDYRLYGFPAMSGKYNDGYFKYRHHDDTDRFDIWEIRWKNQFIAVSLMLHECGYVYATQLSDLDGMAFQYDKIVRKMLE